MPFLEGTLGGTGADILLAMLLAALLAVFVRLESEDPPHPG